MFFLLIALIATLVRQVSCGTKTPNLLFLYPESNLTFVNITLMHCLLFDKQNLRLVWPVENERLY